MKKDTHPTYHSKAKAKCSCGKEYEVGSTMPVIEVEICSNCHPFYTGGEKLLDTAGRVERFKKRKEGAVVVKKTKKVKK
ncbi:MAG: 50S ribosomal protein L31 [Candidatus Paceibacterota bacterium]|jgi:large subunit ribosomal protein L31